MNLRSRLRVCKIKCIPWKNWKGELESLPISSKTLFAKRGLPIDIIEKELKEERYLTSGEDLLEVLKNEKELYLRTIISKDDSYLGGFPEDWTEEDFEDYFSDKRI